MPEPVCPDISVFVCHNCLPPGARLPRQWHQNGAHVSVQEVPCSGKIDVQYIFHAFEGGVSGLCVVTCPKGACTLAQGNYRAEIRMHTARRLLAEIGLEAERAELVNCPPDSSAEQLEHLVREAVTRLGSCGASPIPKQNLQPGAT